MNIEKPFVTLEFVQCAFCREDNTTVKYKINIHNLLSQFHIMVPEDADPYANLVECKKCGLVYVNPRWVFPAGTMPYSQEAEKQYFSATYLERRYAFDQLVRKIPNEMKAAGRFLDIGCGDGAMLDSCQQAGIACEGFEVSEDLIVNLRSRFKPDMIHNGSLENLQPGAYQVVFLINVIEHLPDPEETLRQIFRVLKPGGIVYIHAPNVGGLMAKVKGSNWHQIEPLVHLYYFESRTLASLLNHSGFICSGRFYLSSISRVKESIQKILDQLGIYQDNGLGIIARRPSDD